MENQESITWDHIREMVEILKSNKVDGPYFIKLNPEILDETERQKLFKKLRNFNHYTKRYKRIGELWMKKSTRK